jgi:hypothetical protein
MPRVVQPTPQSSDVQRAPIVNCGNGEAEKPHLKERRSAQHALNVFNGFVRRVLARLFVLQDIILGQLRRGTHK